MVSQPGLNGTPDRGGLHVAIIMDGNGRWAQARGMPRSAGHFAGVMAVRRIVEAAPAQGIGALTLYTFSSDNWKRPGPEVRALMRLLESYLRTETTNCIRQGVRVEVIGRRDRLPTNVREAIAAAEAATAGGRTLRLRLAIDYSSRDEIVRAATAAATAMGVPRGRAALARALDASDRPVGDVDLVIRTGGEQRLSDFLLWESAYAELYFTGVAWPEFDATALGEALAEFHRRSRRFGAVENVMQVAAAS